MEPDSLEELRIRVYRQLASEGRVDTVTKLAESVSLPPARVASMLEELATQRHLVLDGHGEIELAHPFATRDFGFSVKSHQTLWWGGCAWDAFAILHLVPNSTPSLVATTCPNCDAAHAWNVTTDEPPTGDQVAHFLVPMAHVWDDVIHACENQRIYCSEACVDEWLAKTGNTRGAAFSVGALWRLASDWYSGRLERGYERRQPSTAAAYFRDAGLVGEFWGNAQG